jgi:hypothetical protein
MKTAASNKKIREIITMVSNGTLIPNPEFQRRLIWKRDDKNRFIDTILRGLPFPEIYVADGDVDTETGEGSQILVDGQQRITSICQYFHGDPEFKIAYIKPYQDLSEDEKKAFLQYDVPVRDLGNITRDETVDIFKRINATKYSLRDIEINNAVYSGACKMFADDMTDADFFKDHNFFVSADVKRMNDLRFVLSLISAMLMGYTNRDDVFEEVLSRYNDDFPEAKEIADRFKIVFDFIDECGFLPKSRIWKKSDFYTLFIEIDGILNVSHINLSPSESLDILENFYKDMEITSDPIAKIYYQAALQASNDKLNRIRRGIIIRHLLKKESRDDVLRALE